MVTEIYQMQTPFLAGEITFGRQPAPAAFSPNFSLFDVSQVPSLRSSQKPSLLSDASSEQSERSQDEVREYARMSRHLIHPKGALTKDMFKKQKTKSPNVSSYVRNKLEEEQNPWK